MLQRSSNIIPSCAIPASTEQSLDTNIHKEEHASTFSEPVTLNMGDLDSEETRTQNSDNNIKGEKSSKKEPNVNEDFVVYQYLGRNPMAPKETYVYFLGQGRGGDGGFDYDPSRNSFILLVFSIVLVLLMIVAAFNLLVHFTPPLYAFFRKHGFIMLICVILVHIGIDYGVQWSACARRPPCSIILMVIGLLCYCVETAYLTVLIRSLVVILAVAATISTVFVCLLLACSSFDFTKFWIYVIAAGCLMCTVSMIYFVFLFITGMHLPWLHLGILILVSLIQVATLIIQLQMILGGKTIEISEDDYIVAAYILFSSIIDIFITLLKMGLILDELIED